MVQWGVLGWAVLQGPPGPLKELWTSPIAAVKCAQLLAAAPLDVAGMAHVPSGSVVLPCLHGSGKKLLW